DVAQDISFILDRKLRFWSKSLMDLELFHKTSQAEWMFLALKSGPISSTLGRARLVMTDLTPRQILDAIKRGMEETWRKTDRGELRQDGRLDWLDPGAEEKVVQMEKGPVVNEMTPREILDAISRALDRVAARFAKQKTDQVSGRPAHQQTE